MSKERSDIPRMFNESSPCPYFEEEKISTIEYVVPNELDTKGFHQYLARGCRRFGRIFYRNTCTDCSSCVPLRIETDKFSTSRSHKRTLRKNEDIGIEILSHPRLSSEKVLLYNRYMQTKHGEDGAGEKDEPVNVLLNIHYGYLQTIEMNYYLGDKLVGVGIVDEGRDALSSNYFYYDTDHLDRRLGIFSILQEISLARSLGKKYHYLGFYIQDNPKMSYKKFFRPNEIYVNGKWEEFQR